MNQQTRPNAARTWRRTTMRAAAIGAVAAMFVGSAASATDPYPPDEIDGVLCGFDEDPVADDCNDDSGGGGSGGSSSSGSSTTSDCHGSDGYGFDIIKLTGAGIDFGDNSFAAGAPIGPGSVNWSVPDCDYYTAQLVGTLHLDGVSGQYGRMHVSYWWAGDLITTYHGGTVRAPDNGHEAWSVNISPFIGENVDEVEVCTELSDNGVDFHAVNCKTRYL